MRGRWKSWRAGALHRFSGSERGATAIEFGLVAAPFFFLLGGICETGIMLFTEYIIQNATQETARTVRTGQVSSSDGTPLISASEFKTMLCDTAEVIVACSGRVTVYVDNSADFATLETTMPDPVDIGPSSGGAAYPVVFNPGARLRAATVVATYDWDFVFPFMNFLGNINGGDARRVYGLAIFRNEPF
jgi:Flp pilus assembly protein TadG